MNPKTLLYRMVHPSWIQRDEITSQVFRPTPKDNGLLSVYDGDQISPRNALIHFTNPPAGERQVVAFGVVGVTVAECEDLSLPLIPDPASFSEHVLIDFTGLSRNRIKRKADSLKEYAIARGWLFRPQGRRGMM